MIDLVTCKNEEDRIEIEGARMLTILNINFFRHSRAANAAVRGRIWPNFCTDSYGCPNYLQE